MNQRLIITSLMGIALTACSGTQNSRLANGDFSYTKIEEGNSLVVPAKLDKPKTHNDYAVKNVKGNGPVGKNIDIRAPSLVLPIAAGTRVEINEPGTKIWFDQVLENEKLLPFIVNALKQELTDKHSSMITVDKNKGIYQSGWIEKSVEEGFWLWKSSHVVNKMKFQFNFEMKPHGRSVAITTKLIDFDSKSGVLDPIDKLRAEVAMLNSVVGQVDYQYRLQRQEKRILRASQQLVKVSQNKAGNAGYQVEMDSDLLWSNLPVFFEHYGFTVTDLNETKKIYYVDYKQPDNGFFTSLWGDEVPVLDIAEGKYQFKLSSRNESAFVQIKDEQGKALSKAVLTKIFPVIEPGLSFRKLN